MLRYSIYLSLFLINLSLGMEKWKQDMLKKENNYRSKHSSSPLEYSEELEKRAQKWADHLAEDCRPKPLEHMPREGNPEAQYKGGITGENLFAEGISYIHHHTSGPHIHIGRYIRSEQSDMLKKMASSGASKAADSWYQEGEDYPWNTNYDGHNIGKVVGHFTQQVWADTNEVGYGLGLRDGCSRFYVVARYFPTGNEAYAESYEKNVKPET